MKNGTKKTNGNSVSTDPEYIQRKIDLIQKGMPISISESELCSLEKMFRGARSFYIDILEDLELKKGKGENVDTYIIAESRNLAGVELALRKIDEFRDEHRSQINKKT